jgi:methyltransferase-like protein
VPDDYLFHEHLEDNNEPLYFHQFVQRASETGLQYLAEAVVPVMIPSRLGAETERLLRKISSDFLDLEQNMDFITNRTFRQTLLCHSDLQLSRDLDFRKLKQFRLASAAKNNPENPEFLSGKSEDFLLGKKGSVATNDPMMKASLTHLARIYPASIPFAELHRKANDMVMQVPKHIRKNATIALQLDGDQLAERLMKCYTTGLLEFSITPPKFTVKVNEKPVAGPYVRMCAERGERIANMKLQISLLDELRRAILKKLDGQHDRAMLVKVVQEWLTANSSQRPLGDVRKYVEEVLETFARSAMLIG